MRSRGDPAPPLLELHAFRRRRPHLRGERHLAAQPEGGSARGLPPRRTYGKIPGKRPWACRARARWGSARGSSWSAAGSGSSPSRVGLPSPAGGARFEGAAWIWFPEGIRRRMPRGGAVVPEGLHAPRRAARGLGPALGVRRRRLRRWLNGRSLGPGQDWRTGPASPAPDDPPAGTERPRIRAENRPAPVTANPAGLIARWRCGSPTGRAGGADRRRMEVLPQGGPGLGRGGLRRRVVGRGEGSGPPRRWALGADRRFPGGRGACAAGIPGGSA